MKIGNYIHIKEAKNASLNDKKGFVIDITKNSILLAEQNEINSKIKKAFETKKFDLFLKVLNEQDYKKIKKTRILNGQIK